MSIFHSMQAGSLVVLKQSDRLFAKNLGVVVSVVKDCLICTVLWATNGSYRIVEHYKSALLEVNDTNDEEVKRRSCISD